MRLAVLLLVWSSLARAAETRVACRLDAGGKALSGRAQFGFPNVTGAPLTKAYLWLYPNRFARAPAALDDVNFYWVYPRRVSPGFARVEEVTVDGAPASARMQDHAVAGKNTLLEVDLPAAVAPGEWVWLDVTYHVAIPERYGGFGCISGTCTLMGGIAPMPAALGAGGWDLSAAPMRSRVRTEMWVRDDEQVITPSGMLPGPAATWTVDDAPYATAVVGRGFRRREIAAGATSVVFYSQEQPPPANDADRQVLPYIREDHGARVLQAAKRAVELLAGTGARLPPEVTLVGAPLRLELASAQPGLVVVSDKLYEIFPAERFRKFHTRELVRALFATLLGGGRDAEAAAAFLTERFTIQAYDKEEFVQQMLAPLAFIPTVDELIYAPQVAFADAYFGGVMDSDTFRDDPRKMMNRTPRGSLFMEKLRDLVPADAFVAIIRRLVVEKIPLESAVAPEVAASLAQYQDGYPSVNYRLGGRRRTRLPDGRYRHEVDVQKQLGGRPLEEPVEVRAIDGSGGRHDVRWDGKGEQGTVTVSSTSPDLDVVELDPRARTVQARLSDPENDPRLDDRDPKRFKLIYNGVGAVVNLSNQTLGLLIDASVRRIYDLKHALRLQLFSDQAVRIGGTLGFTYRYGSPVTPNRLDRAFNVSLGVSRLTQFADAPAPSLRVSLGATWFFDDRQFLFEPRRARGFSLAARYSLTKFDGLPDRFQNVALSAGWTRIFTPADGHTISLYVEGAAVFGDIAARNQLVAAAGEANLRGYQAGEIYGRSRLTAHVEWRGVISHALDWNFGHLLFMRGISAAAFVEAGAVSSCDAYGDLFAGRNLFVDVGVGLRFNYDDLGVQPGLTALDIAVPLALRPRECLGRQTIDLSGGRPPVMVILSFLPSF